MRTRIAHNQMAKSNQYFRFLLISIVWTSALLMLASCGSARLTVMSFNVRQSHVKEVDPANNWANRKDACLEMLKERRPDLVELK